ncbi:MAG: PAS domain S-box protein [Synechococcaceae cyanobacterium]|nr:PAS domain S-box protein [Synechococcaceae cyanobacterium]
MAPAPAEVVPLATLPVPLLLLQPGPDPRVQDANPAFEAAFAARSSIPHLSDWLRLAYPTSDYRQRTLDLWLQAGEQALAGGCGSLQCRVQAEGGEPREVQVQITAHRGLLLAAVTDVTVRNRAEAALEEARASQAATALAITEAIPVGTYTMVMEPDKPVAYFAFLSERFLELTGLDRVRARENPLEGFACVHPDDYEDWLRLNAEAFSKRQPFKGECRVVVGGETRWITAESVPRELPDGSIVWEGVLIDVTERVLAQQALQASERRLQRLLDNLPIPVATLSVSRTGDPIFCNRRFSETFGYSTADLRDQSTWMQRAYPDPAVRREVEQGWARALDTADRDGRLVNAGEFRIRCADGGERDVLISATRIDDLVVASLVDISERKRSEQALAEARERERRLEEQQRQRLEQKLRTSLSAAAVVHEIDQPLATLLLHAQMARQRLLTTEDLPLAQALETSLRGLVQESERVVTTMHRMRSLLRNVRSDPQPLDFATVIDSALLTLRGRFLAGNVQLSCEGLTQPCPLVGDADQLQVAISNLLRNALEALAGERDRVAEPRIAVRLERQPGAVQLTIADNGPGISQAVLEALPLQSTKADGTGIGLYLVHTAVGNHRGELRFGRSSLGGAQVLLQLPLEPDDAGAAGLS